MSGHSKWATTKHKKALIDSKRSKAFSKLSNSIAIAARNGKDPSGNPALRDIIAKARSINMPHENIERAVKRGSGEIPGVSVSEYLIEAYGPGGVAFLIRAITDNKNRTLGSIKSVLNGHGGRLAETGSVQWMFQETVCFEIPTPSWRAHPDLTMPLIDAGAEEIEEHGESVVVLTNKHSAEHVRGILVGQGVQFESYIDYLPQNPINTLEATTQKAISGLAEALDDCEDIDSIYYNAVVS